VSFQLRRVLYFGCYGNSERSNLWMLWESKQSGKRYLPDFYNFEVHPNRNETMSCLIKFSCYWCLY